MAYTFDFVDVFKYTDVLAKGVGLISICATGKFGGQPSPTTGKSVDAGIPVIGSVPLAQRAPYTEFF